MSRSEPLRSGLAVAWVRAFLDGCASYDAATAAITGADEPHRVIGLPGYAGEEVPFGWALAAIRTLVDPHIALVLPIPGDPRGFPAGTDVATAAMAAGEAATFSGRSARAALVPLISRHGSAIGSSATTVRWQWFDLTGWPDPTGRADGFAANLSVTEAEHDLTDAIRDAASELGRLAVPSWRSDIGAATRELRSAPHLPQLPPGHDPRAVRLLAQADRLAAALELAAADALGGAVTSAEAVARAEALRPVSAAVRRARLAGYGATRVRRS